MWHVIPGFKYEISTSYKVRRKGKHTILKNTDADGVIYLYRGTLRYRFDTEELLEAALENREPVHLSVTDRAEQRRDYSSRLDRVNPKHVISGTLGQGKLSQAFVDPNFSPLETTTQVHHPAWEKDFRGR